MGVTTAIFTTNGVAMAAVIRNGKGEPFSKWKPADKFAYVFARDYPAMWSHVVKEHKFHPTRKWRFDYAWLYEGLKVAVEIDGYGYGHQSLGAVTKQNEKRQAALDLGWQVLVHDSVKFNSKAGVEEAVEQVCRVICGAKLVNHERKEN